ncbi:hypothetical protein AUC43_15315 [Hymenobacter sedentarius]|uniref:DUF3168 domain-containing protein n=1 Tax=Hymenobacter sedentarius TaxID=1411621 RepID=A0A0U4ADT2_9BACT|nr:DUF3168 domain-containing protein [Hymenobacter sedentarius]ALW86332.1 hypothetical protein AUC43_15315 [Hymenobacter sedentarius]
MPSVDLVLQKALYGTLSTAGLTFNGNPVSVYANVPPTAGAPYVVLDQISTVPLNGNVACKHWESVFQLTVLTAFEVAGQVSDLPGLDIQGQIMAALDDQYLPLTDGFQMHPIQVSQTRKLSRFTQNSVEVLRYITLKMRVYQEKNRDE